MKPSSSVCLILASCLLLAACEPTFESTGDVCAGGENTPVRATYTDFLLSAQNKEDYQYYLRDIARGLAPATGENLDRTEMDVLDGIKAMLDRYLDYSIDDGDVVSANNPLDFLEYLISSTDPDVVIDAFQQARSQLAAGIAADDGNCTYDNSNILIDLQDSDPDDGVNDQVRYRARLRTSYSPFPGFNDYVEQIVVLQLDTTSTNDPLALQKGFFSGAYRAYVDDFTSAGFTQPYLRRSTMNSADGLEQLTIDDDRRDLDLGRIEYETFNPYCENRSDGSRDPSATNPLLPDDYATCTEVYAGTAQSFVVRVPQKTQCAGGTDENGDPLTDEDGVAYSDEVDKVELRSLDLSTTDPRFQGLRRIRVEVDYALDETRIYASKYREAIYDSDGTTVIHDPTRCEKNWVSRELRELEGEDTKLTFVHDPNFDIEYEVDENNRTVLDENGDPVFKVVYQLDEDGNIVNDEDGNPIILFNGEPEPLMVFSGRPLIEPTSCEGGAEVCVVDIAAEAVSVSTASYRVTDPDALYDLYMADLLRGYTPDDRGTLSDPDAYDRIAALVNQILGYDFNSATGAFEGADNPMDYFGRLARSADNAHLSQAQTAFGSCVAERNRTCRYSNDEISLENSTSDRTAEVIYQLLYAPGSGKVVTSWEVSEQIPDPDNPGEFLPGQQYSAFESVRLEDYSAGVLNPVSSRLAEVADSNTVDYMNIDDTASGQFLLVRGNLFCDPTAGHRDPALDQGDASPADYTACIDTVPTRPVAKAAQCAHEAGKIEQRDFGTDLEGIQRIRVEVDETQHVTRVYASSFIEKILDSDHSTEIINPTWCEKQAVLAELAAAAGEGDRVSLTYIPDENFDSAGAEPILDFTAGGLVP
jgi:hypothetical protein